MNGDSSYLYSPIIDKMEPDGGVAAVWRGCECEERAWAAVQVLSYKYCRTSIHVWIVTDTISKARLRVRGTSVSSRIALDGSFTSLTGVGKAGRDPKTSAVLLRCGEAASARNEREQPYKYCHTNIVVQVFMCGLWLTPLARQGCECEERAWAAESRLTGALHHSLCAAHVAAAVQSTCRRYQPHGGFATPIREFTELKKAAASAAVFTLLLIPQHYYNDIVLEWRLLSCVDEDVGCRQFQRQRPNPRQC